jgi:hypothetical protein
MHHVFHILQLKKCLHVPEEQIPIEDLDAKDDLSYQKYPIKILETSKRVTQNKMTKMCRVQCSNHTEEEATSERKEFENEYENSKGFSISNWHGLKPGRTLEVSPAGSLLFFLFMRSVGQLVF